MASARYTMLMLEGAKCSWLGMTSSGICVPRHAVTRRNVSDHL